MKICSILLISLFTLNTLQAQNNQLQLARNAVGNLQASVANKEDKAKQLTIVKEGIKAVDIAKKNRKTGKFSETWAIKAYLHAYATLITTPEEAEKNYLIAINILDTAKNLDKEQVNAALINAAQNNLDIKTLQKGNNAFHEKDFFEAFSILSVLSDQYAKDTTLALNVAISAQYIQKFDQAFKYFKRAGDLKMMNPAVYQNLSRLYAANQDNEAAIKALETGIELNPGNNALKNDYINILLDLGRTAKALAAVESALKIGQENSRLFYLYGYLNQEQSNMSKAETAYRRAISIENNYFDALYQLGILYLETAQNKGAALNSTEINSNLRKAELVLVRAHDLKPRDINTLKLLIELNKRNNRMDRVSELERRMNEL